MRVPPFYFLSPQGMLSARWRRGRLHRLGAAGECFEAFLVMLAVEGSFALLKMTAERRGARLDNRRIILYIQSVLK